MRTAFGVISSEYVQNEGYFVLIILMSQLYTFVPKLPQIRSKSETGPVFGTKRLDYSRIYTLYVSKGSYRT